MDIQITTDSPRQVWLSITQNGHTRTSSSIQITGSTRFTLPGFKPNTEYQLQALAQDENGNNISSNAISLTTDSLPFSTPEITLTQEASTAQTGVTIFASTATETPSLLGVDEDGDIVWYHQDDSLGMTSFVRNQGDNSLMLSASNKVATIQLNGNTLQLYHTKLSPRRPHLALGQFAVAHQ